MAYNRSAQQKYHRRQQLSRKLVRLTVWVPEDARERVIELAAKLRTMAKKATRQETDHD